jgi:hypothetical protein
LSNRTIRSSGFPEPTECTARANAFILGFSVTYRKTAGTGAATNGRRRGNKWLQKKGTEAIFAEIASVPFFPFSLFRFLASDAR